MADLEIIIQVLNSQVTLIGIVIGVIILFTKIFLPKLLPFIKREWNSHHPKQDKMPESLGTLRVFIRSGDMIKETRGRILKDCSITANDKTWIIEQIKPYLLTKGRSPRPAIFLGASRQVEYRFKDAVESNSSKKQEDIAGQATNPNLLKQFSDSIVIQKLAAAKPDKSMMFMMFLMGMFALMILQQFIPKGGS
jgi:hypothetical protein